MAEESEVEIKMRLDPKEAKNFASLSALAGDKPERKRLRTVYFDDAHFALARNGLELRVRSSGGEHLQTVKAGRGFMRGEWETRISSETPDLKAIEAPPAQKLLAKNAGLRPVFVVEIERQSWRVERNGAVAEVSVDCGEITSGRSKQSIAEAEVELKRGSARFIFDLARQAIHGCDAPPSFVGKALRGRRLAEGVSETPQRALDLILDRKATTLTAFRQIIDACLLQTSINEEILRRHPGDVEATHQLRVAVRRLRSVFSLFAPMIGGGGFESLKSELEWLADVLGGVRDLDVFVTETIEAVRDAHPDLTGLDRLRERCKTLREAAHRRLDDALRSERFRLLLLDMVEFTYAGAWAVAADRKRRELRDMSIEAFAAKYLQRRINALSGEKEGRCIGGASEPDRHRLRIKAKKLRYMCECFVRLAPPKRYRTTAKALDRLQKSLGSIHDGVAGEQILSRLLLNENDAAVAFAANALREYLSVGKAAFFAAASEAHRKLGRTKPLWSHV